MENQSQSQPRQAVPPARRLLLPARKAHSTVACETCRKRKVKCNAARPTCSYCVSAGVNCMYVTRSASETHAQALKRKLSEVHDRETTFRQIFEHLRDRPETEVGEIVKRIRNGTEPEQILRYIRDGDLLLQLAVVPERRYRYVFPLVTEMPAYLLRPDNPYLDTWLHDRDLLANSSAPTALRGEEELGLSKYRPSSCHRQQDQESPYFMPYHVAEMVEPLLDSVKPSEWTTVSADDVLMRKLLACFFTNIYQLCPSFQKDYFLQDMMSLRQSHCSSLLVNSVLAAASFAYPDLPNKYEYCNPASLPYQFVAEASRLWDTEMENDRARLTTLQASIPLTVATQIIGNTMARFPTERLALDLAERIGLFNNPVENGTKPETRMSRAKAFTGWALFNFQCLVAFGQSEPPRLRAPPDIPLPDPDSDPDWYGQITLRYPADPKLYTTHFPQQFYAQSGMCRAMAVACVYRHQLSTYLSPSVPSLPVVYDYYHSHLKLWYDSLLGSLMPSRIAFPAQFILHHDQTPIEIRDAAARHLETLLRLYYLRHGFEHLDIYSGYFLTQQGDLRSTLLLAAKGLHDQGRSAYIHKAVLRRLSAEMAPRDRRALAELLGGGDDDIGA
ncbi:uncharacterized protein B0T15DRAFT_563508 [Chaetomium strumarium]|uniref:Zn(2)-C6 fungal-type domain-containing protein n=1 Tax=Chaetomium strumarium TaxID=1170767 RepID=A0AAJ0GKY0_9PEZI|nr:hypothetical protein B0T15DRAFT_563508 [Chaetomium strumarium]